MPEDKQEVSQRISAYLAQGQNSQARGDVESLLRDWPGDPEVLTLAGDVYSWTGAPSTAYRHYNAAADTYNRLGKADKMLSVHHKILELDATLLDANTQIRIRLLGLLVSAEDALIAGRYEQAISGYQEAIRQFPNHTVTYQRLATLYLRLGRPNEAVQQYLTVARAFFQHGVIPKALPYFERVLEIEAAHPESLGAIIDYYDKEKRLPEAERFIKAAVQTLLEKGETEAAGNFFVRLPEEQQQDISPLRAALLLQSGDLDQAEDAVKMLDQDRPEISDWFKRMGRAALDRGDSVNADIYFRWANPTPEAEPAAAPALASAAPEAPAPIAVTAPSPSPPAPVSVPSPVTLAPVSPPAPPPSPPPPLSEAPAPAPAPIPPVAAPGKDDERVVLQTMGEMCLAEEMYEEARQVFDRLIKADPSRQQYWDLMNRARSGLGLPALVPPPGTIAGPAGQAKAMAAPSLQVPPLRSAAPPPPQAPPPPPQTLAPRVQESAAATPMAAPPALSPAPSPAPTVPQRSAPKIITTPVLQPNPPLVAPTRAIPNPPPAPPPKAPEALPPTSVPAPELPSPAAPPGPPFFAAPGEAEARPVQRPQLEPVAFRRSGEAQGEINTPQSPALSWENPAPNPVPPPTFRPPSRPSTPVSAPPPSPVANPEATNQGAVENKIPILIGASASITSDGSKIIQTAHRIELGELPPSTPSQLDYDDDIIE